MNRPSLLLHVCCAPCATHPAILLGDAFDVALFFYNPNIDPDSERLFRRDETVRLAVRWGLPVMALDEDSAAWDEAVRGLEQEPEGGRRCEVCFTLRLRKTFETAVRHEFDRFTSTLSVSPHKNATLINRIGLEIGGERYLESDFKKKDGYKKSCELSRSENLYRQNYCGCRYSRRQEHD